MRIAKKTTDSTAFRPVTIGGFFCLLSIYIVSKWLLSHLY